MRTWGLHEGHFIAVDSQELPTPDGEFVYESMVFKCNSRGEIRDWLELDCRQYKYEKDMKAGHKALVEKWITEKTGAAE